MKGIEKRLYVALMLLMAAVSSWGQEKPFPFPAIPDVLKEPQARLEYLMEHYWSMFDFNDTTAVNRATEEQGFVDYIDMLHYCDSSLAAKSAKMFIDSIGKPEARLKHFERLINHYLDNPDSPMRNDVVYAHLLRALPQTPQRSFLIKQVTKNLPGAIAADFAYTDEGGVTRRMYDVKGPLTLLVFFDPNCEHCEKMMPQIKEQASKVPAEDMAVVYVNTIDNDDVAKAYYLHALPSLYLLNAEKRVLIKDGSLELIMNVLQQQKNAIQDRTRH